MDTAKSLLYCSTEEKNGTYILDGLRVSKLTANVHIWVKYPFKGGVDCDFTFFHFK